MSPLRVLTAFILFVVCAHTAIAAPIPPYIDPAHVAVLQRWLEVNPSYRVATDVDCSCEDDIKRMRYSQQGAWRANPNYHPYYVIGDFNWDGISDFAVGVVRAGNAKQFQVVVFHGPFGPRHRARAAFVSEPLNLGQGLFFGDPRPLPHMLLVGAFESEGATLRPSPSGYVWEYPK